MEPFVGSPKITVILSYIFLNCSGRFLNQFADREGSARFLFINKNVFFISGRLRRLNRLAFGQKKRDPFRSLFHFQRKLRDSNSWYGCPYVSLANWWFQPLTQTSLLSLLRVQIQEGIFNYQNQSCTLVTIISQGTASEN